MQKTKQNLSDEFYSSCATDGPVHVTCRPGSTRGRPNNQELAHPGPQEKSIDCRITAMFNSAPDFESDHVLWPVDIHLLFRNEKAELE